MSTFTADDIVGIFKALSGAPAEPSTSQPSLLAKWVGRKVLIQTVTMYFTGQVVAVDDQFVEIADGAWIASTGRLCAALTSGSFDEIEPFPAQLLVGVGAIVNVTEWSHPLPRSVK